MFSSIFVALLQAVSGDPSAAPVAETPAAEAPADAATAPRTERRRVCRTFEVATGGRLAHRRCRYEEVPVEEVASPDGDAANAAETAAASSPTETDGEAGAAVAETNAQGTDPAAGGTSAAALPAPPR